MSVKSEHVHTCGACGATVYPEMLNSGLATRVGGRLLCPHCTQQAQEAAESASEEPSLSLEDGAAADASAPSRRIQYTSGAPRGAAERQYRRPLLRGVTSATRCRTFHCKLTDASFAHLNEQINEWTDAHEDVEIKFATSSICVIEGKHADPHLIVTVFY